eukprot:g37007.t1
MWLIGFSEKGKSVKRGGERGTNGKGGQVRRKPRLGSSNIALTRWLPARYEDGFSLPLGWTPGKRISRFTLPLVREVSNTILRTPNEDVVMDTEISHMLMQW